VIFSPGRVRSAVASGGLLERDQELAVLRGALDRAAEGAGEAVLVEGPAGIGKTALLAMIAAEARGSGARVLQGRGGEYERDFPFGVARQVFEPAIAALDPATRAHVFSGAAALAAPVLVGGEAESSGEDRTFATLHGLFWLAVNLAEQSPLLIAVDDLHWADAPSLRFLHYLVRRLEGLRIGLVGCARPGESSPSPTLLAQLAAEPLTAVVRPAPLSVDAVAKLIVDELGREPDLAFAEACLAVTGGTPFLVHELLRALAEDGTPPTRSGAERIPELGPSTVAHATLLRLAHLPPAAPLLAQAVSVLGPFAERRLAAALAGVDLKEALQAEDALVAIEVLGEGEPLTFSHPIVRTAVYEDLAPGRRAAMHARAAELLSAEAADPDAAAAHLMLAAPTGSADVVERLRAAASAALARGAPESAVSYLTRALSEGVEAEDRVELLLELGSAERLIDPRGAAGHLAEVIRISDDPATRARASIVLAVLLTFSGRWQDSLGVVDASLADLGDEHRELAVALRGFAAAFAAYDPEYVERYDAWRALLLDALEQNVPTAYAPAMITTLVDASAGRARR
jgi:predicted ATPase